jgi:hypothetical protein
MTQQPAQQLVPMDRPDLPGWRRGFSLADRIVAHGQWQVVLALVRAETIIVAYIRLHDMIHVTEAEAEEVIQTLSFQAPDPRFSETVRQRCPMLKWSTAGGGPYCRALPVFPVIHAAFRS